MFKLIKKAFRDGIQDEESRKLQLFYMLNLALGGICLVMSVVNFYTQETTLMYVTLAYAIISFLNYAMTRLKLINKFWAIFLFLLGVMILLTHFIVTGMPQGFSVLWSLLVPACALSIFGLRDGSVFCGVVFADIVFLFWVPYGRSLLQWDYSSTFMLRFPFVYFGLFLIALYLEMIRVGTMNRMLESEQRAKYLYRHDALTGLYNRHAFQEDLDRIFQDPTDEHMAVLLLDIDDFKKINDRYGHAVGDAVLKEVSRIITQSTCEHCISCRWGGEEFLSLMQCRHDPSRVAERIRKTVEETTVTCEGQSVRFTLSVGVATAYRMERNQIQQFINLADKAMYVSKTSGKNRTTVRSLTPQGTVPKSDLVGTFE